MKTFTVEVTQVVTIPAGQTTPGPWHVEDGALVKDDDPAGYFVCHPRTECDATALCWTERKEDAYAMAAAPVLLALLVEADRRIAWESVGLGNDFADRVESAIDAACGKELARHRIACAPDDLTAAAQLEHSGLITREKYNHICENIRARAAIRECME